MTQVFGTFASAAKRPDTTAAFTCASAAFVLAILALNVVTLGVLIILAVLLSLAIRLALTRRKPCTERT